MNKRPVLLFLMFNILNCSQPNLSTALVNLSIAEDPRLPKDPDLKKFWIEQNIDSTMRTGGKYYKFIHVIVQKKALDYHKTQKTRDDLIHAETEEDLPNRLAIVTLISKCMSHIYKLNGD